MASSYGYHEYSEPPHLLLSSVPYGYTQYHDVDQPKTPTSLVTHPGNSPGPLSTPSMSRNASQLPLEFPPDPMVFDDSQSNSPTSSAQTPDIEGFDEDMLEAPEAMREHYHEFPLEGLVSTHVTQHSVPAVDSTGVFSDEVIQDALNATIASQYIYQPQYNAVPAPQIQSFQTMVPSQQYQQTVGHEYPNQAMSEDPWSPQRSPLNPNQPRSSMTYWDPISDPASYSAYANPAISQWMLADTDSNYLISPSEPPLAPPQESFFPSNTAFQHHRVDHSPVQTVPTVPYIQTQPSLNIITWDPSTQNSTNQYGVRSQYSPSSPHSSAMGSSIGQLPYSPFQTAVSPQALSIPSPGASEAMISSHQHSHSHSRPSTVTTRKVRHQGRSIPPSSPRRYGISASRDVSEVMFDTSPEPDTQSRSQHPPRGAGGRAGGRKLGTHLNPRVAKQAHDMRKIVACWHCVLQRDKCSPENICQRCQKRAQRPNADYGLGCSRIQLVDLTHCFLPSLATRMHENGHLMDYCNQYIRQWLNVEITIYMTCGQKGMPRIPVKVYEFLPIGEELLVQRQYIIDVDTHQRRTVLKRSPALGMQQINHLEEKVYDKYISDIVDNYIDTFGELCWREDDNDFQQKLFHLMTRLTPKSRDEAKLIREVFRLIVVTFIMGHALTMSDETRHGSLSNMHGYDGDYANYTSPRMTNRQLKYFFNRLHNTILSGVLKELQQIFRSSKGCDKWHAAFIAVVGLCMAQEDQQKTIHCVMETAAQTTGDPLAAQITAESACREIDQRMAFITHLFRLKYHRKCNPLKEPERDWEHEPGFGNESSVRFVRQVAQLCTDNVGFLNNQRNVSISASNQTQYTSRLVAEFILGFYYPQQGS